MEQLDRLVKKMVGIRRQLLLENPRLPYKGGTGKKIIQHGSKNNFINNTQKLLIIDKKVMEIMDEEDFEDIEYVPIKIEKQEYYILNIMKIIFGSLNMSKSILYQLLNC